MAETTGRALSMTEVAAYVVRYFPPEAQATAVAVAWHESRGNAGIVNDKNNTPAGSRDRGLWQFNDHWNPQVSDACAFDPDCATKAAADLYRRAGWNPWATFKRGAHRPFLEQAEAAVEQARRGAGAPPAGSGDKSADNPFPAGSATTASDGGWIPGLPDPGDVTDAVGAVVNAADGFYAAAGTAFSFVTTIAQALTSGSFWRRVGKGVLGVALVGGAFVVIRGDMVGGKAKRAALAGATKGASETSGAGKALEDSDNETRDKVRKTADEGGKKSPAAAGAATTNEGT
jgi:hypothetical protein